MQCEPSGSPDKDYKMTNEEIEQWYASFKRKEEKALKRERAEAWARGNGYRQALLRAKPAADRIISDRHGHHS